MSLIKILDSIRDWRINAKKDEIIEKFTDENERWRSEARNAQQMWIDIQRNRDLLRNQLEEAEKCFENERIINRHLRNTVDILKEQVEILRNQPKRK